MKAKPTWFSESNYIADKLIQLKALGYEGATTETVTAAMAEVGGAWNHYEQWGYKESYLGNNVTTYLDLKDASGNVVFNTQLYCEAKLAQLQLSPEYAAVYKSWQDVATMFNSMNLSPYDHFVAYGAQEGLTISSTFNANNYFTAKLQSLIKADPAMYSSWNTDQVAKYFAANSIDPYQHFLTYGNGEGITAAMVAPSGGQGGQTYDLTIGLDNLVGTSGNDMFVAYDFDDQNTLQSGDRIDGGAGRDTLEADLVIEGGSGSNTVTPITNNVEVVKFNARDSNTTNGGGNFTDARVDAERMHGVEEFWSTKSRGNVSVEDVMSDSNTVTSVFQSSDPSSKTDGKGVDFEVFFNSQHLKSDAADVNGKLVLNLIDGIGAAATPATPLLDNAYDGITFHFNGKQYTVKFAVVKGATATYAQLQAAIQAGINGNDELKAAGVTATEGETFTYTNRDGVNVTGKSIILTSNAGSLEAINGSGDGWSASGVLPPNNNLSAGMGNGTTEGCPLIQTNIGLDNVGSIQWDDANPECLPDNSIFGSRSGNMIVGGMGARDGVQRFDITADRGSWLNSLSSTNNQLRLIDLKAGDWNGDGVSGKGQVFIGSHMGTDADANNTAWQDKGRLLGFGTLGADGKPGANTAGIWDVKEFNASTYTGNVNIAAQFTAEAYAKYLSDVDGLKTVYDGYAPSGDFNYTFGTGNDTLNMQVNGGIAADRDFVLNMNMGEGNDFVNFAFDFQSGNQVIDQAGTFVAANGGSYTNGIFGKDSKYNVNIDAGLGDDVVKTWGKIGNPTGGVSIFVINDQANKTFTGHYGAVNVLTGDGANVVYAAQQAYTPTAPTPLVGDVYNTIWVLNANTSATTADRGVIVSNVKGAQPWDNNVASTISSYASDGAKTAGSAYDVQAVIDFMGITLNVTVGQYTVATGASTYTIKTDDINNAVMKAINEHAVLSKLLVVKDGAGHSLIVESLISGDYANAADFSISFQDKLSTATAYADTTFGVNNIGTTTTYVQTGAYNGGNDATAGRDEHYYGFTDIAGGAGNDILVTGYADAYVKAGAGNDTILVGNLTYNKITGGTGADNIILGRIDGTTSNGNSVANVATAFDTVHQAKGDSGLFAAATVVTGTGATGSIQTGIYDVIHNFDRVQPTFFSDHLVLDNYAASATPVTLATANKVSDFAALKTAALTNNSSAFVQGTYNAATGTFIANGTGDDMFLVYDADASTTVQYEGVVLTGLGGATALTYTQNTGTDAGFLTVTA